MFPYLRLGPFLLPMAAFTLLGGLWVGSSLAEKEAARLKLNAADVYNLIFYGLIAGLAGARLAYALHYPSAYLANPLDLLSLLPATLDVNTGLALGLLTAALFGWRKRLPLRPTLDALAPGLAAFVVALGLAHLFSGDAFGAPTQLPWSVYLWDEYRHPSQIYETLAALTIFGLAWRWRTQANGSGLNFVRVVALSAAAYVFLEAFRGDSVIWLGGLRAAQTVGVFVLGGCWWWIRRWEQSQSLPLVRNDTSISIR